MLHDMKLSRRRVLAAGSALAATAVLAACGEADDDPAGDGGTGRADATATPPSQPEPTATAAASDPIFATEGDAAAITIEYEGGFLAVEDIARRTPLVSLFNDGALIYPGPIPEIFPQPAAPNLLVTVLSEVGLQAVGEQVLATGLFEDGDRTLENDGPAIADAPTTVFTVRLAGQEPVRVTAPALDFGAGLPGQPSEESGDREQLAELLRYLTSAPTSLPTDHIAEQEARYTPERLEVIAYPWDEIPYDFDAPPEPLDWPLADAPLTMGEPYALPGHAAHCAVLEGGDLDTMLAALAGANILDRWEHDGEYAAVIVKALIPGQEGCISPFGETTNPPEGAGISYPEGDDELVLRYEFSGGFVPLEWFVTSMPVHSLYGDGRMISEGPQITIYPPPVLPALNVEGLTPEGVQMVLAEAESAGLLAGEQTWDELTQYLADAQTGVLTINANGETHRVSVYAPGMTDVGDMVSDEELEFRTRFNGFVGLLGNLAGWLPADAFRDVTEEYPAKRLQLVSQPAGVRPEEDIAPNEIEWPLDTPLAELGEPYTTLDMARCFVLEGDAFATVMSLLNDATTITRWTSAGEEYILHVRPLLPDEAGCKHPLE